MVSISVFNFYCFEESDIFKLFKNRAIKVIKKID